MRAARGSLSILILALAVLQWLMPLDRSMAAERATPAPEQMRLFPAADLDDVREPGMMVAIGVEALVEEAGQRRTCFAVGPLRDKARAVEIGKRYAARQVKTELESSLDKQYLGVMVYLDGHATRAEAKETAAALTARGIRDHIIINPEGRLHLLSLGVFKRRRNAELLQARLEQYGFQAGSEVRYREQTVYYVYGEQASEGEPDDLLDERDLADGIVRIPTPCAPT